ncbi:hypothetical protein QBC39DRAFT_344168 [Podospora conica]|nr:hypothetical protein QBC39DRAFT_344168 [Schizothecium conicum]
MMTLMSTRSWRKRRRRMWVTRNRSRGLMRILFGVSMSSLSERDVVQAIFLYMFNSSFIYGTFFFLGWEVWTGDVGINSTCFSVVNVGPDGMSFYGFKTGCTLWCYIYLR